MSKTISLGSDENDAESDLCSANVTARGWWDLRRQKSNSDSLRGTPKLLSDHVAAPTASNLIVAELPRFLELATS
jgi:hypothetical protein